VPFGLWAVITTRCRSSRSCTPFAITRLGMRYRLVASSAPSSASWSRSCSNPGPSSPYWLVAPPCGCSVPRVGNAARCLLAPRPSRREPLHGHRLTPLATLSSRALSLQYTLHLLN
jgi:hypothetical protein